MGYQDTAWFMGVGLVAWLSALALLVAYRLLTGAIWTRGLLTLNADGASQVDMERLQLLIVFLISVVFYIKTVIAALDQPAAITIMPEPPGLLTEILFASNAVYLAGKFGRKLQNGDM